VDEVERLIVRRIAVQMKQRQDGRHAGKLSASCAGWYIAAPAGRDLCTKLKGPAFAGPSWEEQINTKF
jgi:hypothetical protein